MGDINKNNNFSEIISIIENAKSRALKAVNAELITMYFEVGKYLSDLCSKTKFGDKVINDVEKYIKESNPTIKGFNRRGLYRMKQFYELYKDDEFVSTLLTQISWSNHLIIMSSTKNKEERHFYIELCIKNQYSFRELERQIDSAYYQRYMLSVNKPLPENVPNVLKGNILDTYVLEFLDLPKQYTESNYRKSKEFYS